ncbi:MAG: hypothetical protein ABI707_03435 [Ferruginibacter sp.]
MKRIFFFLITFLVIAKISVGQIYTWNGLMSTDYQVPENWTPVRTGFSINDTLSFNPASPISVTNVANQTVGAIQIATGTSSVTFSTNLPTNALTLGAIMPIIYTSAGRVLAGDFLTIELNNSNPFTISSGTFGIAPGHGGKIRIRGALILAGGTLDIDVAGTGGATISGPSASITYISGTFSSTRPSSITWAAGSNYYHAANGSTPSAIPVATWQAGSTCNITGMNGGTSAPTGFAGINFANFTWNCVSQNSNIDLLPAGAVLNIVGILSIASTGGANKALQLSAGNATVRVGLYTQTGGTLTLQAGAGNTNLRVSGNFSQTGGVLDGVGGSSAGVAVLDLKGNVTRSEGAFWQSTSSNPGSEFIYQFSGTAIQTVNVLLGTWNSPIAGRCSILNSNTDIINGINLTGILKVCNTNSSLLPATLTMNGVITGSGGVTYTGPGLGGNSLIYGGNFFQTASNVEFPASGGPLNVTINNVLGVNFPSNFNRTITGKLSMLNGNLAVGDGNTLSLANLTLANQLNYTRGFITTGTLGRYFPTSGLPLTAGTNSLFPFGSGANARFLNIFFSSTVLSAGTAGMVYVTHSPIVDATAISLPDNNPLPTTLNKRTNTNWAISTGGFNLGAGGETVSLTAVGGHIGSVNDYTYLRLTDGITPDFGTLIATTGNNAVPTVGKSKLSQADINKVLYIGSDSHNLLIIITFTWTGLGGNTNWVTPGNWTGGVGYPNASTDIAIINSTSGEQPTVNTGTGIDVYRLTVGAGITLTMLGTSVMNVFDIVSFTGTADFAPSSTFAYTSSGSTQNILNIPYGGLAVSGTAQKILPPTIALTGLYSISGVAPNATANSNTFIYAGAGAQFISPAKYYNLTITGNRGGALITISGSPQNPIDIQNIFDVSSLSNDSVSAAGSVINFSNTGPQTIPGFYYYDITNTGNGPRTLDPLGSSNSAHVIKTRTFSRGSGAITISNSKIELYVSGTRNTSYVSAVYYDLTISGDLKNFILDHETGAIVSVAGTFHCAVTNFQQGSNAFQIFFNGTGDQTITAFKSNSATNTPAFKYSSVTIAGGNRNVILGGAGTDTIAITGSLTPETNAVNGSSSPFAAGKGFIVAGSTVDFGSVGSIIPSLKPALTGTNNYNNVVVSSGTRLIATNMTIDSDLTLSGTDTVSPTILTVGNGSNIMALKILGNLSVTGNAHISGRANKFGLTNKKQ